MRSLARSVAVAILASAAFMPASATAAPTNVRIDVYVANECGGSSNQACPNGTALGDGAVASGTMRIRARAQDTLGLRRIRIEGRIDGKGNPICIAETEVRGQLSADFWYDWDSSIWPEPEKASESVRCTHTLPHYHGEPTPNGRVDLRVTAISFANDQDTGSSPQTPITLRNAPIPPEWSEPPTLDEGTRTVALSWVPGSEPDLVAYRINRTGPDGVVRRLVEAASPERSGCSKISDLSIRCPERLSSEGGSYSFTLVALRPGGTVRCFDQRCMASAASEARSVEIAAETNTSPTTPGGPGGPTPTLELAPTEEPTGTETPSSPIGTSDDEDDIDGTDPLAAGDTSDGGGTGALAWLSVVLLLGGAGLGGYRFYLARRG